MAVLMKMSMPAESKYGHQNNGSVVIVHGEQALDGTNPTRLDMKTLAKMDRVFGGTANFKLAVSPGDDPVVLTVNYAGTDENFDVYAWKHTTAGAGGNPTLIASTATTTFSYTVVGQVGDRPQTNF